MTVHEFIRTHQAGWKQLEEFLALTGRLSLARVPLAEFRRGSLLYRQAVADLAYARMRFAGHSVVRDLERRVGLAHSLIYQARRGKSTSWSDWFRQTWPARVRAAARPILIATALFWIAAAAGFVLTMQNPVLERIFISPPMREAMDRGHLWTESITGVAPQATGRIATNNISVALLTWGLGLTFGLGTVWLLLFNGVMLGAVAAACLRAGLLRQLAEFVIGHGALELPAIWIAGGAGLMLGGAMLFPGRYSRRVELRRQARISAQIMLGLVPMLLLAALIEGFVSPSDLPGVAKAFVGFALAVAYLVYILQAPAPEEDMLEEGTRTRARGTELPLPVASRPVA
jgi:uncharacterized membrane protein SpoIIM required for sporulation